MWPILCGKCTKPLTIIQILFICSDLAGGIAIATLTTRTIRFTGTWGLNDENKLFTRFSYYRCVRTFAGCRSEFEHLWSRKRARRRQSARRPSGTAKTTGRSASGSAEVEAVAADGSSDSSPNRSHNSDKCLGSRHLNRCSDSRLRNRSIECPRDRPENRSAFTNSRHRSRFGDSRRRSKFGVNSSRRVIECLRARPKSRSVRHTIFRHLSTKIQDAATAVVGRGSENVAPPWANGGFVPPGQIRSAEVHERNAERKAERQQQQQFYREFRRQDERAYRNGGQYQQPYYAPYVPAPTYQYSQPYDYQQQYGYQQYGYTQPYSTYQYYSSPSYIEPYQYSGYGGYIVNSPLYVPNTFLYEPYTAYSTYGDYLPYSQPYYGYGGGGADWKSMLMRTLIGFVLGNQNNDYYGMQPYDPYYGYARRDTAITGTHSMADIIRLLRTRRPFTFSRFTTTRVTKNHWSTFYRCRIC